MGEAIISRGGGSVTYSGTGGGALIQVTTWDGAVITCSKGSKVFTKNSEGYVEFTVDYGTWTLTSVYDGKTRTATVVVDTLKVFTVNLKGVTYGVSIDMTNSDPGGAVTYTDDAVGFSPLSCNLSSGACDYGSWEDIITETFGCKPCLYLNGARSTYLKPTNYAQTEAGATADITSGNSGDVMVEFKKTWYKFAKSGNTLTFQVADYDRSADGFVNTAFASMDGTSGIQDYMYYSAYEGYNSSNKIRSLSGKTPTGSITYTNSRTYCKANGTKYGMEDMAKRCYILGLLMLVTKTRGVQASLGNGRCGQSSGISTGTLNSYGLFAGFSDNTKGHKCFGIENFWGNFYKWCDGIITNSSTTVAVKNSAPYNDSGSGYETVSDGLTRGSWLYATAMAPCGGGSIILPSIGQSDTTKGWCDGVCVGASSGRVALVGGSYNFSADRVGPFCLGVYNDPSDGDTYFVSRLVAA